MTPNMLDVWNPPVVALVGLGMAGDDLAPNALRRIGEAEVLAGGKRHLEYFPDHCGEKIVLQSGLQDWLIQIDKISSARRTVVLTSGDPFYFGLGQRIVKQLGKDRVLAYPNITTVQALFARLKEPWEYVKVLSLHGRKGAKAAWMRELRYNPRIALFTDPSHSPDRIARMLLDAGFSDRMLVAAEDLGLPTERIRRLSLEEASREEFSPLNLVALFPDELSSQGLGSDLPVLGIPDEELRHQAGLITKMEVRAVVLAQLQLKPDLVLWDLGAGSGSIAIEAARIGRLAQVVAVEKNEERCRDLIANVKRFQCPEIRVAQGNAAEILSGLPDPDRVFIGGSGGDVEAILDQTISRLRPGGRVVQTAVTLDTVGAVNAYWQEKPFKVTVTQLQVNRSAPIGKTLRLEALNPVFIFTSEDRR